MIEFIIQFNRALNRWQRQKEVFGDCKDENCASSMQRHTPMEVQVAKLYTRFLFENFQVEELKIVTCFMREKLGDGNKAVYT